MGWRGTFNACHYLKSKCMNIISNHNSLICVGKSSQNVGTDELSLHVGDPVYIQNMHVFSGTLSLVQLCLRSCPGLCVFFAHPFSMEWVSRIRDLQLLNYEAKAHLAEALHAAPGESWLSFSPCTAHLALICIWAFGDEFFPRQCTEKTEGEELGNVASERTGGWGKFQLDKYM